MCTTHDLGQPRGDRSLHIPALAPYGPLLGSDIDRRLSLSVHVFQQQATGVSRAQVLGRISLCGSARLVGLGDGILVLGGSAVAAVLAACHEQSSGEGKGKGKGSQQLQYIDART